MALVGAGAAATTLGRALAAAGWVIDAVVCRTPEQASRRVAEIGAGTAATFDEPWLSGDGPIVALLGVPDEALAGAAARLARLSWPSTAVALHLSGAMGLEPLAPLAARGVATGSLHPLTSFTDPCRDAATLATTTFAVAGESAARALGESLVSSLGGHAVIVPDAARAAWHAGAAHASNHLVALVDQSLDLLAAAGLERTEARAALVPLLRSVLTHLEGETTDEALTGPVVRGDVEVVVRHLEALASLPADAGAAYRALSARAVEIAERSGRITPHTAQRLRAALRSKDT